MLNAITDSRKQHSMSDKIRHVLGELLAFFGHILCENYWVIFGDEPKQ